MCIDNLYNIIYSDIIDNVLIYFDRNVLVAMPKRVLSQRYLFYSDKLLESSYWKRRAYFVIILSVLNRLQTEWVPRFYLIHEILDCININYFGKTIRWLLSSLLVITTF